MNPQNNSLARTYLIGGPPRVGKSILAFALAEKIRGHMVSTDAIRSAAKKACSDPGSDLFMVDEHESKSTQALAANRVAKIQWADLTPISRRDFIDWIEAAGHQRKMGAGLQKLVRCW